jgi:hypothetical protein
MKTTLLLSLLLASAGALGETQAEFDTRQYQQRHIEALRAQTRALEASRYQAEPVGQGLTSDGQGNLYFSRGQAAADALNRLADNLNRRGNCIVSNGRVYCEGN